MYVGSSSNTKRRWSSHRSDLRRGKHKNPYLQNAWDKYGEEAFEFVILEECAAELLLEREQVHLDQCADRYNLAAITGTRRGVPYTDEQRARLSESRKGRKLSDEHKKAISAGRIGRKVTPETLEKMREAAKGNKNRLGQSPSPETRAKISASKKGQKLSPESIEKIRVANTGRKHTDEARARMSDAAKKREAAKRERKAQSTDSPIQIFPQTNN